MMTQDIGFNAFTGQLHQTDLKTHQRDRQNLHGTELKNEIEQKRDGLVLEKPSEELPTWTWSNIVWSNVVKLGFLHIFAIWGIFHWHLLKWQTHVFGLIWLQLSGLSVTVGAHRLWCHRSYKAKSPLRAFLMILNCIAAQNDLYEWVRDHRVHHKYSDTNADPHNINRGLFFSHMGWLLFKKHPDVTKFGRRIDCSDVLADPIVRFQRRYYGWLVIFMAFLVPTYVPWLLWNESLLISFLVPTCLRLIASLHFTWSVNSLAHYFGDKPFDKYMAPTETTLVSFWAVGEGFHNFHHAFPFDYSCSELGWFVNPSKLFIDLMAYFDLAYDCRSVSRETILRKKLATGDGTRLPARIKEIKTMAIQTEMNRQGL
ncbi:stearoyl-CoA desaturase 5-like isoform X2 [Varroa jacobsoni]|uniref:Fatty acid desaturase domain-containing protein n=1 Tax=Varroa destructor TaxID=109461 RepID=A0A7M7K1B2_VARDE|nr:stearoyl-CoA desaturase 5-like isoform X2 [Varroa destructor]XP_022709707.1 stearoyl-CoA desaturase 5-like isoform X2 [Varroa jacobsoni]